MVDEKDNSGGNKVRFAVDDANVDKDLSIHPSAHNENNLEGAPSARTADKYYKDMQSIHGDMVRRSFFSPFATVRSRLAEVPEMLSQGGSTVARRTGCTILCVPG